MGSPFDVLRIEPDADDEEVDAAYRHRVMETHPDQGGSAAEFQLVTEAYEAIKADGLPAENRFAAADAAGADSARAGDPRAGDSRTGDPRAGGPRAGDPRAGDPRTDDEVGVETRVTYLNYAVLDDYEWALDDDDLFEKAAAADLSHTDYGQFLAQPGETLLEAAENRGFAWPFACRGGACANCAVAVLDGEIDMPVDHILPSEMLARDIRLSCGGRPITEELRVIYNLKHLPDLDDLRLPPHPFENAQAST
ncbi:MAG: ferredoxin Fer [Halopenitus sp.]